jgi:hypothetical protein
LWRKTGSFSPVLSALSLRLAPQVARGVHYLRCRAAQRPGQAYDPEDFFLHVKKTHYTFKKYSE